jgi:hypothetical protein
MIRSHPPIGSIDKLHHDYIRLHDLRYGQEEPVDESWEAVGHWLDQAKPLDFWRNTGKPRK